MTVVQRHPDRQRLHRELAELAAEWGAETVVIGLPVDLDGQIGPAAQGVLAERDELATVMAVPVIVHDERMTTKIAERALQARGDMDGRERRKVIDMVAASVILQDWLDANRPRSIAEVNPDD